MKISKQATLGRRMIGPFSGKNRLQPILDVRKALFFI
jgi:hypothetical protein